MLTYLFHQLGELKNYYRDEAQSSVEVGPNTSIGRPPRFLLAGPSINHDDKLADLVASLPPRAISDLLVAKFFDNDDPAMPINYLLHRHTFMDEYVRNYEDPSPIDVAWLGLLFSMLCLASRFSESEEQITYTERSEYAAMSDSFYQKANSCLDMVDTVNLQSGTIEFMSVFLHAFFIRRPDSSSQVWLMAGDTVRLAMRMGYHRDPASYGQFTPFEIEMRRRVWQFVSQTDLLFSFQLGLPPVIRTYEYDSLPPQNYHEEQLSVSMEKLSFPQPCDMPTHFSYMISNSTILQVFRLIVEQLNDLKPLSYDDVMLLHQKLLDARRTIPAHLRPIAGDDDINDPYFAKRTQLDLFFHKVRCVLHRKFMVQVRIIECYFLSIGTDFGGSKPCSEIETLIT